MPGEQVRLYIGGLPGTISCTQISERFEWFGKVHGVELVAEKEGIVRASQPLQSCRGFAYVQFSPSDEASLRRCISMYNGCKWLGGILRVEPAKPDYRQRLAEEADEDLAQEAGRDSQALMPSGMPESSGPIHLASRDGRKVHTVVPNPVKMFFPPARPLPVGQLSWEPIEQPPGFAKRHSMERHQRAKATTAAPVNGGTVGRAGAEALAVEVISPDAPRKRLKVSLEEEEQPKPQPVPQEPSSSSELAAVDFMSSDDEVHQPGAALGTRFDSSEDEEMPAPAMQQPNGSVVASQRLAKDRPATCAGHHTQDANMPARSSSRSSEASLDGEVLPSRQLGRDVGDIAHAESSEEALPEEQDDSEVASESLDGADAAADLAEDRSPGDSVAHQPRAPLSDESEAEDPSEPEEDALHDSGVQASDLAGPALPATQPAGPHAGDLGWRSEHELPAASQSAGGAPPEDQAEQLRAQREEDTLRALGRLFPKGAAFHRGGDPKIAEAAWMANREAWMADCKTKRRMALRQQSEPKQRMH